MIRVLIADESRVVNDNIARRLALEDDLVVCGTAGDGESAVQEALWLRPDIAVVDAGLPGMDGGQTTEMLAQCLPSTGVIMMSMEAENDAYRLAMLAGAREFLQKPFRGDDLVAAVRRVHAFGQRRLVAATAAAGPPQQAADVGAAVAGLVTAVIAGKGGVGKTVVAINLATELRTAGSRRVVLVDLSLQFGDIAAALALPTDRTIGDLLGEDHLADHELVRDTLVAGPGGISVMLAPITPDVADGITPAHLTTLVETLRADFDHIVLDTPSYLTETTLNAVTLADHVVLVTDLSVPGVKNTRLVRGVLDALKVPPTRVLVVGNHRESAGELDSRGAEKFLGTTIVAEIPYDATVVATSINTGVPFVIKEPRAKASLGVHAIATAIDAAPAAEASDAAPAAAPEKKKRQRHKLSFSR
ncbi:MAG: response regulator [Candidatus Dormibacteria bacterium]|jgi:pilus assembly protein CpaE